MNAVTVATFNQRELAEPIQRKLEQAGIPARIETEERWQRFRLAPEHLAGTKVKVDESQVVQARQLLADWDLKEGLLRQSIRCPECGSPNVEYPQLTRKFLTPSLHALLFKLRVIEKEFYCLDCQFTWPAKEEVPSRTDVLGWPLRSGPSPPPGQ